MSVTRRSVLEHLAELSEGGHGETTTIEALTSRTDADRQTVETHLEGLAECELARVEADSRIRITITGEELLRLNPDELLIIDPQSASEP